MTMASTVPAFPSTKETTNYSRLCRLLVDVGTQVLREKFDKLHPPADLHKDLWDPSVHAILQSLFRRRVLNAFQWEKLYPRSKSSASSTDFDITLLTVLLRNICGLTPPATGWDNLPAVTDLTAEADVARVKGYRNTVYGHASQASVDDATFNSYWNDIREALIRLGGPAYGTAIDDLKDECMDPDIAEHYRELLKQWSRDEDSIKEKLDEMVEKLDELKASVFNTETRTAMLNAEPLNVTECQRQLRMHYNTNTSQVRITPWDRDNTVHIDEVYTNLSWRRVVKKPNGTIQQKLDHYTEIFKGHGRVPNPKRVLVYGRPGIGKSSFSQKIAFDWANEMNETLKKFDLLLLLKLRDVCGVQTVPDILKTSELLAADGSISGDSLYEYVRQNQEGVLLVLDGYDEYSGAGTMSPVLEIWEGKQLRDCHVVITTRPMEGEELKKSSNVQCEIRGFRSKEQVNDFAQRFLCGEMEISQFNSYLNKEKLWDFVEIPLLLLMLCLIWKNRHHKQLPTSTLLLHKRFVETLLCHMSLKDPNDPPLECRDILDEYREDITAIGRLAFEALLKSCVYVDIKKINTQSESVIDKMVRSGLFQVLKPSSARPSKSILFLNKSIQEFLAAWYLMTDEAKLEEYQIAASFRRVDSFDKALKLKEILKFMCEWSTEGARAVFQLLKTVGSKEGLTQCHLTKTPSLDNLTFYQGLFRDVGLECLIACPLSARREVHPIFLSAVGGTISVNIRNMRKVAAEHLLRSSPLPNYLFFECGNFDDFVSIVDDLRAVIITCSALRLEASVFLRMYKAVPELKSQHFFLKKEGDKVYLYFNRICRSYSFSYLQMIEHLTSSLSEATQEASDALCSHEDSLQNNRCLYGNCFSLVREVDVFVLSTREQVRVISDLLSVVASPEDVVVGHVQVDNDAVSHINFSDNLNSLRLEKVKMNAKDVAFMASSLYRAPNLHSLKLLDSVLQADSVGSLSENLCFVPQLSHLRLSGVGMDDQGCSSFVISLKHVAHLTVLDLSKNHLGRGISDLAKQLKHVPRLLHLNLERTTMGEKEASTLAQAVKSDASKLCTLQLGGNPLGRGVSVVVQNLRGLSDLKHLDLQDVEMTKEEVDAVSAALHGIVMTSYHDLQGNPKPEREWPVFADA